MEKRTKISLILGVCLIAAGIIAFIIQTSLRFQSNIALLYLIIIQLGFVSLIVFAIFWKKEKKENSLSAMLSFILWMIIFFIGVGLVLFLNKYGQFGNIQVPVPIGTEILGFFIEFLLALSIPAAIVTEIIGIVRISMKKEKGFGLLIIPLLLTLLLVVIAVLYLRQFLFPF